MLILVTNDDGIYSEGLRVLAETLESLGKVVVVAPDRERSASAHSLTLDRPVRVKRVAENRYAIDGTPTDCVNLAVNKLMSPKPDFIVSGINHGANLGDDITYSGTVAAAVEGTILGYPSIAISAIENDEDVFAFDVAGRAACELISRMKSKALPPGTFLNVNVPPNADGGRLWFEFTSQGKRIYSDILEEKIDPRGRSYYWLGGDGVKSRAIEGSDCHAVDALKRISVTPIQLDMTNYQFLNEIRQWDL